MEERRHHQRRKEDRERPYEVLAYQLECSNDDLEKISDDIHKLNKKFEDERNDLK